MPSGEAGGSGPPILPSRDSWHSVARRIHRVSGKPVEFLFPEKAPTFLAVLPSSGMFLIVMEVADAVVLMLELTKASSAIGEVRRVAANPLLAATGFHQWCMSITAKATALSGNGFRFHPIVCHSNLSGSSRCLFTRSACLPGLLFSCRRPSVSENARSREDHWQRPG